MTAINHLVTGQQPTTAHRVEVRRRSSIDETLAPNLQCALLKLTAGSPMLISAIRALAFAAKLLRRSKELIHQIETTGCRDAGRAIRRHAAAVRVGVERAATRTREQWITARQNRIIRLREAIEARSVAHCREWASW